VETRNAGAHARAWETWWRWHTGQIKRPPSPLEILRASQDVVEVIERERERLVQEARALGASWEDIGRALGITKQSAWKQYRSAREASSNPLRPAGQGHG
jgi:hypothetical protein